MRSNREKKKPKADKNNKKKAAPAASPFTLVRMTGKELQRQEILVEPEIEIVKQGRRWPEQVRP